MCHTIVFIGNYLSCQEDLLTLGVKLETKRQQVNHLRVYNDACNFEGYNPADLMSETAKLRKLITKRGTLEMLIPLCCTTDPVRHKEFRGLLKGFRQQNTSKKIERIGEGWYTGEAGV